MDIAHSAFKVGSRLAGITVLAIASLGTGASRGIAVSHTIAASQGEMTPQTPIYAQNSGTDSEASTESNSTSRFSCQLIDGEYTVMYNPQSQPEEFYSWAKPQTMGGGWSADRRCAEISRRLEAYRPDGLLEMRTDVENGYNTVCVSTEAVADCRIVFTVPVGQDPVMTRDRVFENLAVADSGQQTEAVTTYRADGTRIINQIGQELGINLPTLPGQHRSQTDAINLRPFLDPADGGTGTQLRGGDSFQAAPRLNPGNFR